MENGKRSSGLGIVFGIVFLEAWACGTPIVGADIGPIRSLVQEGRGPGALFPAGDAAALSACIAAAVREPAGARPATDDGSWSAAADVISSLI